MSRIVIVAALVAAGVAAWLLIGGSPDPEKDDGLPSVENPTPTDPPPTKSALLERPKRPTEIPAMQRLELDSDARLLMIARLRSTWTATIEQTLARMQKLEYRTWYMLSTQTNGAGGGTAGPGRGMSHLTRRPTAEFLAANNIQALLFDEADPNDFPIAFWNVVAERVRSGEMGLYFRPGFPLDEKNQGLPVHPALAHPVLKELLPVRNVHQLTGSPLPGVFPEKQPIAPTAQGFRHPATRLVPVAEGSRNVWHAAGVGEGALGSKFCYPTDGLKPDAVVLLNLEAGINLPAVIVSGGNTRVLWMGNNDFGDRKTHFARDKDKVQRTLMNHWWMWLLGQIPE